MNNTPTRSDEVDGAFPIHHNVRQKVPDTRRGDDGVQISTPRSRNEVDGAFSRTLPRYQLWLDAHIATPCTSLAPAPRSTLAASAMVLPVV